MSAASISRSVTGTRFQFVPYRGAGPAMQDLVAGQIDIDVRPGRNSLPQVRAGTIKAYAVTAKTPPRVGARHSDRGRGRAAGILHLGLARHCGCPKGTPKEIIAKLNAAVVERLADPAVRKRLAELGQEIPPRSSRRREALAAHHKAEIEKWWPIIKAANIKGGVTRSA